VEGQEVVAALLILVLQAVELQVKDLLEEIRSPRAMVVGVVEELGELVLQHKMVFLQEMVELG
jgi:hypothetical protein